MTSDPDSATPEELVSRFRIAIGSLEYVLQFFEENWLKHSDSDERKTIAKALGLVIQAEDKLRSEFGLRSSGYDASVSDEIYRWTTQYSVALRRANEFIADADLRAARDEWKRLIDEHPPGYVLAQAHRELSRVIEMIGRHHGD